MPSSNIKDYEALSQGLLKAVVVQLDGPDKFSGDVFTAFRAYQSLLGTLQSKYSLPVIDGTSVGLSGSVPIQGLVMSAWANCTVPDGFIPGVPGSSCAYLLIPISFNRATWSGPLPSYLAKPEDVLSWQIITNNLKPLTSALLKGQLKMNLANIKAAEASVATWDTAARIATGIATFGLSELVAICGAKVDQMKKALADYAPMRAQAMAFLNDPRCTPDQKRQISNAMAYDGLISGLVGGKASASDATAQVAADPNIPGNLKSELSGYMAKVPKSDLDAGVNVAAIVQADQPAPGVGFVALAALEAIPVGTMICIAVIVVALIAGIVVVLGPLLRAIGAAVGAVVSTLGGPGLVLMLALGGAGYYFYKNPGAFKSLAGKLHLKM